MKALTYYLSLPFFYLLSLLPFRVLYIVSDIFFLTLYYVVRYRREVVFNNLKNSFPEKTTAELNEIQRQFYRYFCDFSLETFKSLTISKEQMLRHCSFDAGAQKIFDKLAAENQNSIIVMGHHGNWEWAGNTFSICCQQKLYVIYHPLANKYFNGLIIKMRRRFGTRLIPMKETFKEMIKNRDELNCTAFIADQAPNPEKAYWMEFMNQDTPVFMGTEKIAQKTSYPIVFASVIRLKRGYYTLKAELLLTPPFPEHNGAITEVHTRKLEQEIIAQPQTWLWTHKRWKHKRF